MSKDRGRAAVNGNVSGKWECKRLMNTIGWQHAKVKSTKRNPPQKFVPKCHNAKGYTFKI